MFRSSNSISLDEQGRLTVPSRYREQLINDQHQPVMHDEVLDSLNLQADGIYVDATFGRGGHTKSILAHLNNSGTILVIDKDPQAIAAAKQLQQQDARIKIFAGSYAKLGDYCKRENLVGKINGILLDLGVSSPQLDVAERGFSFTHDGPLDMRMDPDTGISAAQWLNSASQDEIEYVLKTYGEEKFAWRIAREICACRLQQEITTTKMLADLIKQCYPIQRRERRKKHTASQAMKHPATQSFQAIRIYINDELADLQALLAESIPLLAMYGRLVIISFHSLEDRIVKQFINYEAKGDQLPSDFPIRHNELHPRLGKIGKRQRPSLAEVEANKRARSAILRVAEKIEA